MIGPDVQDERMMELHRRGLSAKPRVPWKTNGLFLSLLFFVLTSIGVGATYLFFQLAGGMTWLTVVICIGLAEYLIGVHRFFGTGVESALWLGGLFVLIFELPGEGSDEAILLFAVAAALAGLRVRNPFFGALAAVFVIAYLVTIDNEAVAIWAGVAISVSALVLLAREWRRPSTEALWTILAVIPPIASCFATIDGVSPLWVLGFGAIALAAAAAGLILHAHAHLIAAGVYAVLAASVAVAWELLPYPREWSLILGGSALLAASALVARELRHRTDGVVATPDTLTRFDDEVQILATLAAEPRVDVPAQPEGGGKFGGAGATGDY